MTLTCFAAAETPVWQQMLEMSLSLLFPFLPPKGFARPLRRSGSVQPHGSSWRAEVWLSSSSRPEKGPSRDTRPEAEADLDVMRAAASWDDVPRVAEELRQSVRQARRSDPREEDSAGIGIRANVPTSEAARRGADDSTAPSPLKKKQRSNLDL